MVEEHSADFGSFASETADAPRSNAVLTARHAPRDVCGLASRRASKPEAVAAFAEVAEVAVTPT